MASLWLRFKNSSGYVRYALEPLAKVSQLPKVGVNVLKLVGVGGAHRALKLVSVVNQITRGTINPCSS
jgi:nucleoid-associated protein YgaU